MWLNIFFLLFLLKIGDTPLLYAALDNKQKAVEVLLSLGADATIKNNYGKLPIDETKSEKIKAILRGTLASLYCSFVSMPAILFKQ